MKFFFDNNLSPHMARGIGEMSKVATEVHEIKHLCDLFARDTTDVIWIQKLNETGPGASSPSIDSPRTTMLNERRCADLVTPCSCSMLNGPGRDWLQCERLVRWWPQILEQSRLVSGGAFRVPWAHSSGSKFQDIKL